LPTGSKRTGKVIMCYSTWKLTVRRLKNMSAPWV
jgi:hypothetical protein